MIDIQRLRELEAKATKGPWRVCGNGKCTCKMIWSESADTHVATGKPVACVHGGWGDGVKAIYGNNENVEDNASFLVELRNALPDLLARLEKLEAVREAANNARESLTWATEMFVARDEMNAKVHCSPIRLSPITERCRASRNQIEDALAACEGKESI